WKNSISTIEWKEIGNSEPNFFFSYKDLTLSKIYSSYASIRDIFPENSVGCVTGKDSVSIDFSKQGLWDKILFISEKSEVEIRTEFNIKEKDARDWTVPTAKKDIKTNFGTE